MNNHFRAELYKLRHSRILSAVFIISIAIIMVSFVFGEMTFFGAGDGTKSVIGFQAKSYLSETIPTFHGIARSTLAYTAFFWLIGVLFAISFFVKEYHSGTIKLAVAYGAKRAVIYYAKVIIIFAVSLVIYLLFITAFFAIETVQSGYIPTPNEMMSLFGWGLACGIALLALESVAVFLCVLIPNTGVVMGICCLYVFSGASVYLMLWSSMDTASIPMKIFVYSNPMYYWMNFCSGRTVGIIEHLPFYFLGSIILLVIGGLIMKKKEIK